MPGPLRRAPGYLAQAAVDGGRAGEPHYEGRLVKYTVGTRPQVGRITAYDPGTQLRARPDILAVQQWQLTFTPRAQNEVQSSTWIDREQLTAGLQPKDAVIPRTTRSTVTIRLGEPRRHRVRKPRYTVDYTISNKVVPWHDAAVAYWRNTLGFSPDADKTIALRLSQFATSTVKTYTNGWRRFEKFCHDRGEGALPQSRETVMQWIALDLAETVGAANMQPYLTAVNDAHIDTKAGPAPALGIDVRATVNGLKSRQTPLVPKLDVRVLRATEVGLILDHALARDVDTTCRASCERLRNDTAVVVDYSHFNRGDTGVRLRPGDLVHDRGSLIMRKRKLKAGTGVAGSRINMVPVDAVPGLDSLITKFEAMRGQLGLHAGGAHYDDTNTASLYRLPWESAHKSSAWPQAKMTEFLLDALQPHGIVAPGGMAYNYHSLRHGAATDAHAINVPERRMRTMGNWSAGTSKGGADAIDWYIDELAPATAASYRFFGWLLPAHQRTSASPFSWNDLKPGNHRPLLTHGALDSAHNVTGNSALAASSTPPTFDVEPAPHPALLSLAAARRTLAATLAAQPSTPYLADTTTRDALPLAATVADTVSTQARLSTG